MVALKRRVHFEELFRTELVDVWGATTMDGLRQRTFLDAAEAPQLRLWSPDEPIEQVGAADEFPPATMPAPSISNIVSVPPIATGLAQPVATAVSLSAATEQYHVERRSAKATRAEYRTTLRKWDAWISDSSSSAHRCVTPMRAAADQPLAKITEEAMAAFVRWVHERAVSDAATNPGRVANKAREQLVALLHFGHEQRWLDTMPRVPKKLDQVDEAGLFFFTEDELNRLYWSTYELPAPRSWTAPHKIGAYWRAALTFFYLYGVDTQTVFRYAARGEPLRWKDIFWDRVAPTRQTKSESEFGWVFYRRTKTDKPFLRPMNREIHGHLRAIQSPTAKPDDVVFLGGSVRPCEKFQHLCRLAKLTPIVDPASGRKKPWQLKLLRKTSGTEHDANHLGAGSAVLGHSSGGPAVTERHYVNRDPVAFQSILTLPIPAAFRSIWDTSIKPPRALFAT